MVKRLVLSSVIVVSSSAAFAQTPATPPPPAPANPLGTRAGHELTVSVQQYEYVEPLEIDVRMHGLKFGLEYTGTFSVGAARRWFVQLNARATGFMVDYDGSCRPWQIVPSQASPNGYRLTVGSPSPCAEDNDPDGYGDARALVGRDFGGRESWGISPFAGVGFRHLSNGTTGNFNYRTQEYLYVPLGVTARTRVRATHTIGFTIEYDRLIRGWNKTRNSLFGAGTVPATETTPELILSDFSDLTFKQTDGWALRASAAYDLTPRWSIEPYYVRWQVDDSPLNAGSIAFTVNGITARQSLNYLEPHNFTNEFGVKVGFRFGGR
jgi:hypothetical protein